MNTKRGQFRGIEMDDLSTWADSPLWNDERSKLTYQLPLALTPEEAQSQGALLATGIPANELYRTAHYTCCKSPTTHRAAFKHAIDFLVLDDTPILAADGGMVVEIQQHSDEWGDNISYRDKLNYITIQHSPTEFTQYCHLARNSVRTAGLYVGSAIKAGQIIGSVGKTGLTDRDHLHFIVFRLDRNPSPFGFKSLVPRWK
jgi:murein DD-endopeptidase MepM/ murein hydrolase activator NlpD